MIRYACSRWLLFVIPLCLPACGKSTSPTQVPEQPASFILVDNFTAWFPSAEHIVYHRAIPSSDGPPGLYRISIYDRFPQLIVPGDFLWPMDLDISPDGTLVACTWQGQVEIIDASSGIRQPITFSDNLAARPDWSPDGSCLVYDRPLLGHDEHPDSAGLFIYELRTNTHYPIPNTHGGHARWSPSGDRIAFTDGSMIMTISPQGGIRDTLYQAQPGEVVDRPRWLAGGSIVAFEISGRAAPATWLKNINDGSFRKSPVYLPPTATLSPSADRFLSPKPVPRSGGAPVSLIHLIDFSTGYVVAQITEFSEAPTSLRSAFPQNQGPAQSLTSLRRYDVRSSPSGPSSQLEVP